MKVKHCPIKKINPEDGFNYFFGYYDKNPWNKDESKVLAHRVSFLNHFPKEDDEVEIGTIDLKTGVFEGFCKSTAWNWQQGCQLQWINWMGNECAVYNIKKDGELKSEIYDFERKNFITFNSSIYAVSPDNSFALTLNYGRLYDTRKDYGISGILDPYKNSNDSALDGIYKLDFKTGESDLIISLKTLSDNSDTNISNFKQRVNHIMYNDSGSRFCFLHRYFRNDGIGQSRLFTANADGTDIRLLFEGLISHFDWMNDETILAWAGKRNLLGGSIRRKWNPLTILKKSLKPIYYFLGKPRILMQRVMGDSFYLISDKESENNNVRIGMGIMYCDGHCTYSRDKRWILTDGYTDSNNKLPLFLYDTKTNDFFEIGRYKTPKYLDGELRIDLHPRFNKAGDKILIDSGMDGNRGMYIVNVEAITNRIAK